MKHVLKRGGVLLMMLVIFGMFLVIGAGAISFINRQFHVLSDKEQEQKAFYLAEVGLSRALFILNDNVYTPSALINIGTLQQTLINSETGEPIGTHTSTFEENPGDTNGQSVIATVVGQDSSNIACEVIIATIARIGTASSPYEVTSWDNPPGCEVAEPVPS